MLIAYYPVSLALAEQIRSHSSHHGRVYPILTGGASASLHVSQNRRSGLNTGSSLDPTRHTGGMSYALRVYDDMVLLTPLPVRNDIVDNLLLIVIVILRKQNILRAVGNSAPQGNVLHSGPLPR